MIESSFVRLLRIICFLILGTAVWTSLVTPCSAQNSENTSPGFNSIVPVTPPSIDQPAGTSDIADLQPVPPGTMPKVEPTDPSIEKNRRQGVKWGSLLSQSAFFLGIKQGYRLGTQPGTRDALKGEFFSDWFESVKSTRGWGDGDDFLTNYIGHPMEGSVAAYIFVHNDPNGRNQAFSWDYRYWNSRFKATAWTALYSTQFELGPISEASLGNVGYHGKSLSGFVDLVVTPIAGLGWQVGEDVLDKYLIVKIESWTSNPWILTLVRGFLNPTRSFANVIRLQVPWARDMRPGIWKNR
jgi:hypothetical protein